MNHRKEIGGTLFGEGVEIGAYFNPWPLPAASHVHYVDLHDQDTLRRMCDEDPHLKGDRRANIPVTTFIGSGESLPWFPDKYLDFIVSSHVIEHFVDPIGAVRNWIRKTRSGGKIVFIAPNKEHTFDRDRPITPWGELLNAHSYRYFYDQRRFTMFCEWRSMIDGMKSPEAVGQAVRDYQDPTCNIHFSVWDYPAFVDFVSRTLALVESLDGREVHAVTFADGFESYAQITVR